MVRDNLIAGLAKDRGSAVYGTSRLYLELVRKNMSTTI
jgi:hypothetical protein